MAADVPDWPADPDGLVRIATDPSESGDRRRRARDALRPLVLTEAAGVSERPEFRDLLAPEYFDRVCERVFQNLPQYQPGGNFLGWVRQEAYFRACDLRRRGRRRDALTHAPTGQAGREQDPLGDVSGPDPGEPPPDPADELAGRFARAREVLDRVAWPQGRGVDYYAVFLLALRVRVALEWRRIPGGEPLAPGASADRAATSLPWREQEQGRRFLAELPPLAECWQALRLVLDLPALGVQEVVAALNASWPPDQAITVGRWNQWTSRARQRAQACIPPDEWQTLFAHWFSFSLAEEES
jgi:DNA-directed RNA polymerase specialized sigma24 family protein